MSQPSLLSSTQRTFCQTRADQPAPNGPRARALLALDQGNTQQQAAEQSGLSLGQVRYCLRRFRTVALEMFDTESNAPTPASPSDSKAEKGKKSDKKDNKKTSAKKGDGKKASKSSKKKKKK